MNNDLPPELAAKIKEIEREITECEDEGRDIAERLRELRFRREDYLEAAEICRREWCASALGTCGGRSATESGPDSGSTEPEPPQAPRQRRDLREVVRQVLRDQGWLTIAHITRAAASAIGRTVRESEIVKALARMGGEVEQIGNGWRLAARTADPEAPTAEDPGIPPSTRQRRDLREVVRQILASRVGATPIEIANIATGNGRIVREKEILMALYRLNDGVEKLDHLTDSKSRWRLAAGPSNPQKLIEIDEVCGFERLPAVPPSVIGESEFPDNPDGFSADERAGHG